MKMINIIVIRENSFGWLVQVFLLILTILLFLGLLIKILVFLFLTFLRIFRTSLDEEYECAKDWWGLDDVDLAQMNLEAARSSFLPENDKNELLSTLRQRYKAVTGNLDPHNYPEAFEDRCPDPYLVGKKAQHPNFDSD